jgi:hypothetical protein
MPPPPASPAPGPRRLTVDALHQHVEPGPQVVAPAEVLLAVRVQRRIRRGAAERGVRARGQVAATLGLGEAPRQPKVNERPARVGGRRCACVCVCVRVCVCVCVCVAAAAGSQRRVWVELVRVQLCMTRTGAPCGCDEAGGTVGHTPLLPTCCRPALARRLQHQVGGLDVAVDVALLVQLLDRMQCGQAHARRGGAVERAARLLARIKQRVAQQLCICACAGCSECVCVCMCGVCVYVCARMTETGCRERGAQVPPSETCAPACATPCAAALLPLQVTPPHLHHDVVVCVVAAAALHAHHLAAQATQLLQHLRRRTRHGHIAAWPGEGVAATELPAPAPAAAALLLQHSMPRARTHLPCTPSAGCCAPCSSPA